MTTETSSFPVRRQAKQRRCRLEAKPVQKWKLAFMSSIVPFSQTKTSYVPSISARVGEVRGWASSSRDEGRFSGRSSGASALWWSFNERRCKNAVTETQTYWQRDQGPIIDI